MFHFSGCREPFPMNSGRDDVVLKTSGYPIRKSPGQRFLAAHRGLSQRVHVLHRLLAPRHSLCALSSLFSFLFKSAKKSPLLYFSLRSPEQNHAVKLQFFYPVCGCQRPGVMPGAGWSGKTAAGGEVVGQTGLEPVTPRLSSACSNQLSYRPVLISNSKFEIRNSTDGGDNRIRTGDLLRAKQTLYQLSYDPS